MGDKPLVYIAGPITGVAEVEKRFGKAEVEVASLGYTPVSPLKCPKPDGLVDDFTPEVWNACVRADIRALLECDGIYLLRGWENSRGARLEKLIADGLDMFILFQSEGERDGKSDSRNRGGDTPAGS